MDFNKVLQELIDKANKSGYDFKDGKFEKAKQDKFPVMEEFLIDNSVYEETGYWKIFKKTIRISDEDYKLIKEYAIENDNKEFKVHFVEDIDDEFYEIVIETIYEYDESEIDFINTSRGGTIQVCYDDSFYDCDEEEKECVDFWFSKEDDDCQFPRGYVSFYEMTSKDFEKADKIDIDVEKFMHHN